MALRDEDFDVFRRAVQDGRESLVGRWLRYDEMSDNVWANLTNAAIA